MDGNRQRRVAFFLLGSEILGKSFLGGEKSTSPSVDPLILQDAGNMTQLKWVVNVTSE